MKRRSKEQVSTQVAQILKFCMVYANVDGFCVGDGAVNGGIFLANVCKAFKATKFVSKHKWTEMIFKTKEYTKRDATLMGNLFNFTQLVENEGTLQRKVILGCKYSNTVRQRLDTLDETKLDKHCDDVFSEKICTTNISRTNNIAILFETEKNQENKQEIWGELKLLVIRTSCLVQKRYENEYSKFEDY